MDDWASDGEGEDLGDLGKLDLPEVKITAPPVPTPPPAPVVPVTNAWQRRDPGDVRAVMRGPASAPPSGGGPPRRSAFGRDPPAGRSAYGSGGFGNGSGSSGGGGGSGGGNGGYGFNSGGGGGTGGYGFNGGSGAPAAGGGPASGGGGGGGGTGGRGVTLYVSNLPPRVDQQEMMEFFKDAGCVDVRLTHHTDTGNVKAAFVVLSPDSNPEQALSYDGRMFGSRTLHVKIDGERRSGSTRERQPYGSGGFGVNGSRERERDRMRSNGGGGGGGERGGGHWGGSSYEPPNRGSERAERASSMQAPDPTIPTGPAPAGRKRLVLKPRTKPMPTLDIDHRAIGGPTNRSTRSSGMNRAGGGGWGPGGSMDNGRLAGLRGGPSSNGASQMPKSAPPRQNTDNKDVDKVTARMANTKIGGTPTEEKPVASLKNSFALLDQGDE